MEPQTCRDNTYYLTIPFKNPNNDEFSDGFLYDTAVSNRDFFKHSLSTVTEYVRDYTYTYIPQTANIEIVQTKFCYYADGTYLANVLIKTFWLKIIQRRWKNVCKARKLFIRTYYKQLYNQNNGCVYERLPGLRGCLVYRGYK